MNVDIGRFRVRWTLADAADGSLAQDVLGRLVDEALEDALTGAFADHRGDLIAIRTVDVPALVVRHPADAGAWAGRIAAAAAGTLAHAGPDVVRYRTTRGAAADVAGRVARGDLSRVWAWRQLGLWRAADPAAAVAELLAGDPAGIVPILDAVGPALPALVGRLGPAAVRRLAAACWAGLGANPAVQTSGRPAGRPGRVDRSVGLPPALQATLRGQLGRLLRELTTGPDPAAGPDVATVPAAGPGVATVPAAGVGQVPASDRDPSGTARPVAALLVAHACPAHVAAGNGAGLVDRLLAAAAEPSEPAPDRPVPVAPPGVLRPAEPGPPTRGPEPDPANADHRPTASDSAASTAFAGLLFCLHPLRPLLDPAVAAAGRSAAGRSAAGTVAGEDPALAAAVARYGWPPVLHATGRRLLAMVGPDAGRREPNDPALLAFCGRSPAAPPPPLPADPDDTPGTAVGFLADGIVAALRERLRHRAPAARSDAELLNLVLRRRGRIVADPGWLDVQLEPDEVSVDLRAAGLDFDPGWLPALGCVVRFRYG